MIAYSVSAYHPHRSSITLRSRCLTFGQGDHGEPQGEVEIDRQAGLNKRVRRYERSAVSGIEEVVR
jgi:hypothetical protein